MEIFCHHIYEFRKGLRKLILYTGPSSQLNAMIEKLEKRNISYLVDHLSPGKVNIFFGSSDCISVLKEFSTLKLEKLSDTEDFILGAMLGYDIDQQCRRFVKRLKNRNSIKKAS